MSSKLVASQRDSSEVGQLAKSNRQLCRATKLSEKVAQLCCVSDVGLDVIKRFQFLLESVYSKIQVTIQYNMYNIRLSESWQNAT